MKSTRRTTFRRARRTVEAPSWVALLEDAVREPGMILAAYSAFHEFSVGNMLAAYSQCASRGLPLGPLGTYPQWVARGRQVRAGEKALVLCVPRTVKARAPPLAALEEVPVEASGEDGDGVVHAVVPVEQTFEAASRLVFSWQARWFVLGQTDGDEFVVPPVAGWDREAALRALDVTLVAFEHLDGNIQGYTLGRCVALNPLAAMPQKTLFHELGHVLLHGGTAEDPVLARSLREVEAEAVALLCVEALGLPGAAFARGYIQAWLGTGQAIPEANARRILAAADRVIKAGRSRAVVVEGAKMGE